MSRGYEAIARALTLEGVEVVFGVLGASNDRLVHELVKVHGVRFVPARHEQGAVGMADGYSRATGTIGVATVEKGPGLTNTATAMTAARLSRSPVLLVAGDKVAGSRLGNMDIDQPPFIRATTGAMQQVNGASTLATEVALAFRHLRLGLGPIALNVPTDVSEAEMPDGWEYAPSAASLPALRAPAPDPGAVRALADRVRASARPVVLAGRGALRSAAREDLLGLAEHIGAVLATTLLGKGWFAGDPFDLGISGGFAPSQAREILGEADIVIAFGAALNPYTLDHGRLYPQAALAAVDVDPAAIGSLAAVDGAIVGDAAATARALVAELREGAQPAGWRSDELAARIRAIDPWADCDFTERPGYVNRHELVRICEELLPRERMLAVGIGHFMGMPTAHLSVGAPGEVVLPWRLGAIGSGMPAGIGAAVGRPDRTVVVFEGYASLMMTLQDLETAARCRIPVLVIVENDGGHGSERISMRRRGDDSTLADFANPDFAAVARSLGADGHSASSAGELRAALAAIGPRLEGPALIDVRISPEESDVRMTHVRSGGPI